MDGSSPPADVTTESKPERYIYKDGVEAVDASLPSMEIPIIDFSNLLASSSSVEELEKLRTALISWGCFQAINHGIPSSLLDEIHEITREFFALQMKEKMKYSRAVDDIEGYGTDMVLSEHQILDFTSRLYLLISPEDQRNLKFWPETPETFRETIQEYTVKIQLMAEVVLVAMARSLNLKDNSFLNQCGERAKMFARFNHFPQCSRSDHILGLKPHADGSAMTIVLPDKEVEGLQFLKEDKWIKVPIIPYALLINVGDQIEIMSNGIFKSPVHRVVTNSERERISLAVFCSPETDKEIKPVDELTNKERPRLYKTVKNYVDIFFQYYQQGKRPIDAFKI